MTTLKAITINADKVESKVEEFTYEIVLSSAEPVVTPDSGVYTDYTEIKVEVPQGSTAKFRGKSYTSAVPLEVRL